MNRFVVMKEGIGASKLELLYLKSLHLETIQELQFILNILTLLFILLIPIVWYVLYRYFKGVSKTVPYYVNQNRNT